MLGKGSDDWKLSSVFMSIIIMAKLQKWELTKNYWQMITLSMELYIKHKLSEN